MYGIKKIDITAGNVKLFYDRYGNGANLQPLVNSVFEKFLEGKLIELNNENHQVIIDLAGRNNNTCSEIMDLIISNYEWEIGPREKQKITLDVAPVKVKKKKKLRTKNVNAITNY